MYLKRITVRNIKCFADFQLDFGEPGHIRPWTALLGRNGLGKSTLLQAMAAATAGPSAVRELLPVAERWVRDGTGFGTIEADLLWTPGDASAVGRPSATQPLRAHLVVTGGDPEQLPRILAGEYYTVPTLTDWGGEGP